MQTVDVDSGIPGFSHSRIFLNRNFQLANWASAQGWNWAVAEWPYLVKRVFTYPGGEQVTYVLKEGLYPRWFDLQEDGSLLARYGADDHNSLEALPGDGIFRYSLIVNGSVVTIDFHDFDQPSDRAGMMKRRVDASGFETTVTGYGDMTILGLETVRGGVTYRLTYDYIGSGDFEGKLDTVAMESEADSVITPLRRARYLYHSGGVEGNTGDLKAAITQQPSAGAGGWEDVAVRYYRYTTNGLHLLTYVVGPTMYMLLKQAGQDVLTMAQSAGGPDLVPQYANNYFEYDGANRVVREVARGDAESTSPEGIAYIRVRNPHIRHDQRTPRTAADFNTWTWKIIEEGREGYRTIMYTNKIGQPIATVKQSLADPARQWITAVRRGDSSAAILEASPAAVARIDETLPDLIGYRESDGSFANLHANVGLVSRMEYYDETTATSTVPGSVAGFLKSQSIQQGWQGGLIPQSFRTYLASDNSTGPVTYVVGEETTFRSEADEPASRITLSHSYAWYAPAGGAPPRIQEEVITFPAVPVDEGGDGVAHTTRNIRDESGNVIWQMDERGVISRSIFDVARGVKIREVADADTAPLAWSLLPGPHAALTTDYSYDGRSRRVLTLGPEHLALVDGVSETVRRAEFVCYVETPLSGQALFGSPVLNQIRTASGYRLSSTETDAIINPVLIELQDKCERTLHRIAAKRSTGTGALGPLDTFLRADWSRWTANLYNERGLLAEERVYHVIPAAESGLEGVSEMLGTGEVNYDAKRYAYAANTPLLVRVRDEGGTLTRMIYDEIDRVVATFVGTQDVPDCTSEDWYPDAPGTNLVLVASREYDLGQSGGNSLLTRLVNWTSADEGRHTVYAFDFRGRETARQEEEGRYLETDRDNLNNIVETRLKGGNASGPQLSREAFFFSKLGRLYEIRKYGAEGSVDHLFGLRSYDPAGNLLVSSEPGEGGRKTWRVYDNLGRETETFVGCPVTVGVDLMDFAVEKSAMAYDPASNVIAESRSQLDTGVALSSPTYRTIYGQRWFDPIGRNIASADLGALGSLPIRPASPPPRTDTELVSENVFNERAELFATIDPAAREDRFAYDDKGRLILTIENYVAPGFPSPFDTGANRTQRFAYTPDDLMRELVFVLSSTEGQMEVVEVTRWEYGVTRDHALIASNQLIARKVYPNDTADVFSYNRQGDCILRADANGTVHRLIYDGLARLRHDCVPAVGEKIYSPVRRQSFFYDQRGLLVSAQAHNSPNPDAPTAVNEVAFVYDAYGALSRQLQEHYGTVILEGPSASKATAYERTYSGNHRRLNRIVYPSGKEYQIDYGVDGSLNGELDRVSAVVEASSSAGLVEYHYLGLSTLVRKTCPEPGVMLDLWGGTAGSYTGLDRFSRVTYQRWSSASADCARLQYGYDRSGQRLWRLDSVAQALSKDLDEIYTYDGLQQIKSLRRGRLDSGHSDLEPDSENFNETWGYDAIGNWQTYYQGDPEPILQQHRSHNIVDEIIEIDNGEGNPKWPKLRYDAAGNMTRSPGSKDPTKPFRVDYDAWNRVSRVATFNTGWQRIRVAVHVCDARGWRVQSGVYVEGGQSGSILQETWDHYYDAQWRCVEDWTTQPPTPPPDEDSEWTYYSPQFRQRLVWDWAKAIYPDSLVLRDRDTNGDGEADERLYALQDAHFNVVAIVDAAGAVSERFGYTAFGKPLFYDPAFESAPDSGSEWTALFAAYSKDFWIDLYYVRNRCYHPALGRWTSRDPLQEEDGQNLYCFVKNNPIGNADYLGTLTLGYKGTAPQPRDCGALRWDIQFTITTKEGEKKPKGVIYQIVSASCKLSDCKRAPIGEFSDPPKNEAWKWPGGAKDTWIVNPINRSCIGSCTFSAVAYFSFDKSGLTPYKPTAEAKKAYKHEGKLGIADYTVDESQFPSPDSNQLERTLNTRWNCCQDSASNQTTITMGK